MSGHKTGRKTGQEVSAEEAETPEHSARKLQSALATFSTNQRRALAVMTIIALLFGAYFLYAYLELIALAGVLAYLFTPLYRRFGRKMGSGASATLTLLCAIAIVIIPLGGVLAVAGVQIAQMVSTVSTWVAKTDMGALGHQVLDGINDALGRIPFVHVDLTLEKIQSLIGSGATYLGEWALSVASQSVGGIVGVVTSALIFLYVFIALLSGGSQVVGMVEDLSPLDPKITRVYVSKIGAMVKATVGGQFVIAIAQGLAGAISIYIGGIHQGFFMFLIFLSLLSIIPLGSGIVTIPLGVVMALSGNIPGGIFVAVFHILVTSNIDNVLRPMLVPKTAYLPPAVMLLAVFAGLSMFGFLGIVFGPVIMIIIVTTIDLYRTVVKGAPWPEGDEDDDPKKESLWAKLKRLFTGKRATAGVKTEAAKPS